MTQHKTLLEDALDNALDRLAAGESPQSIASDYSGHETEMAGLLRVAGGVATLQEMAEPSPIALATGRRLMLESAARRREGGATMLVSMITGLFRWRIAPALRAHPVMSLVMAAMLLGASAGGGAIAVASESLPDSPFYSVKLASEQVQLALASDTRSQESLRLSFEERRESERQTMEGRRVGASVLAGKPSATRGAARTPEVEHTRVPSGTVSRTPEVEETHDAEDDCDDVTPVPGATAAQRCTETPHPSRTPQATKTPDDDDANDDCDDVTPVPGTTPAPQCTETPHPSRTPRATETPDADDDADDDCDDVTPVPGTTPAPQCTETPHPSRTPQATETPDGDDDDQNRTPVAGPTRTPRPEDDHKTETPEPTHTPRPSVTPKASVTPHPSRTPEHTGAATPTRTLHVSPTPTRGTGH
jgi:hypothetical protein